MQDEPEKFPKLVDDRHDLPLQLHYELDDRPLSVWAFRVYAHFVRRAGRNGRIFPTYKSIAEICFRPTFPTAKSETLKRRAMEAVKELEAQGLVRVHRSKAADGDNNPNIYHLTPRRDWRPLVQCTPPDAMHPPSAMHPEVNQVQANQVQEKDGAKNRAGRGQTSADGETTPQPPVRENDQSTRKAAEQSRATALEKVPPPLAVPPALAAHTGWEEAWGEWLAYRRARRLTCAPVTLQAQLKKLAAMPDPLGVIEQSITNGWAGLFQVKQAHTGRPQTTAEADARAASRASDIYRMITEDQHD